MRVDEPGEPGAACAATRDRAPTATPDLPAERQRAQGSRAAASVPAVTLGVTTALPAWGSGMCPPGAAGCPRGAAGCPRGAEGCAGALGTPRRGHPTTGQAAGKAGGHRRRCVFSSGLGVTSNACTGSGTIVSSPRTERSVTGPASASALPVPLVFFSKMPRGVSIGECHTRGRLEGRAWCRPAAPGSLPWFEIWNNSWVLSWFFRALH